MKEFPRDDQEWVASLPYYGTVSPDGRTVHCAGMFPSRYDPARRRPAPRQDVEAGFRVGKDTQPEEIYHNHLMASQSAAFADIIAEFTGHLYRGARDQAIFRILGISFRRRDEQGYGTRVWFRSVCAEAVPPRTGWV